MTERTGYWVGPDRWAGPVVDDPDPTGGRHAFDQDANLTPIFTNLRRTVRRPVPRHPVPDPADHLRLDPPTTLIPVVRPLHPDGPERGYDAPLPLPVPAPSPVETTTWGRAPVGPPPVAEYEPVHRLHDRGRHDLVSDEAAWDPMPYDPAAYDPMPYDPAAYDPMPYDPMPYDPMPYDPAAYDRGRFGGRSSDPYWYDPVTDTGRHHRRLAPAGW